MKAIRHGLKDPVASVLAVACVMFVGAAETTLAVDCRANYSALGGPFVDLSIGGSAVEHAVGCRGFQILNPQAALRIERVYPYQGTTGPYDKMFFYSAASEPTVDLDSDVFCEWIDGPWGCFYSNIAVWDWDMGLDWGQRIEMRIMEGDDGSNDDPMGSFFIDFQEGRIWHLSAHPYGWIELQTLTVTTAPEPAVEILPPPPSLPYYWFESWNGVYPEPVQGPPLVYDPDPPIPHYEYRPVGSQYFPYHLYSQIESDVPAGSVVGLMGGRFPALTLSKPMIYQAIDVPAVFGSTAESKQSAGGEP